MPDHGGVRVFQANTELKAKAGPMLAGRTEMLQVDIGGGVVLDGWLIKPRAFDPSKNYPIVVNVYGEPAGTTYALTGEGIGKALETGALAAECASEALRSGDDGPLRAYAGKLAALAPRYRGYRVAQSWLSWPPFCDLVARRVRASARLRAVAEGILNETIDPRRLFSLRALAASFWR